MRASTVSDNLSFDIGGTPVDLVSKSVSGDLTVRIPAGLGVDLVATWASDSISLDEERHSGISQKLEIHRGDGTPALNVRSSSVSGNVSVVHRTPSTRESGYSCHRSSPTGH